MITEHEDYQRKFVTVLIYGFVLQTKNEGREIMTTCRKRNKIITEKGKVFYHKISHKKLLDNT